VTEIQFSATNINWYDMIYLTAVGLTAGGGSTVHIHTQTQYIEKHSRHEQYIEQHNPHKQYIEQHNPHKQYIEQHNPHKQYIEQHNSLIGKSADRAPYLRVIPWHFPYKWERTRKNLSHGSRRMPVGKEFTEQSIRVSKNT